MVNVGSPKQEWGYYPNEHGTLVGEILVDRVVTFEAGVCLSMEVKISCMVSKIELEYESLHQ